jgi:hypothetical protein
MWYLKTSGWDCEGLLDKKSEYKMIRLSCLSWLSCVAALLAQEHVIFGCGKNQELGTVSSAGKRASQRSSLMSKLAATSNLHQ